ncbi:hypothetical protein B0I26_101357 [Anoxybacillus vitaminiphilus]|uniref:Uncharacterized protein n=1 Tax=Paranoxybacillus vitaminiphilus TaxID=581036 RepID=A0A327YST2_9BACL|nr:hypothetical protein [Anoxybacillus vitaminiphilus]RAK23396.1 hypothetical protein B0I26_101357 [Anoxybacillus vitaminiphilus]
MSLKLVELQVALPRTYDIGKIQEQMAQQSQFMQSQLAASIQKKEELQRRQVTAKEKSSEARWKKEGNPLQLQTNKKMKTAKQNHPYKGTMIDFTG